MTKIIRLTETDLTKIVNRVIEEEKSRTGKRKRVGSIGKKWYDKTNNSFFIKFVDDYPTQSSFDTDLIDNHLDYDNDDIEGLSDDEILDKFWSAEGEIDLLQSNYEDIPNTSMWVKFKNDLGDSGW
jgi:hypothetical protein